MAPTPRGEVIDTTLALTGSHAEPVWVPGEFLLARNVGPWMELPLWLPDAALNMSRVSAAKAIASGLSLMPLEDIIDSTLQWYRQQPPYEWPAGISSERERELLNAWAHESHRP